MKNEKNAFRFLLAGYSIAAVLLFLFSYTQVDLNLTLSKVSIWQTIQKGFQHIGYYERPLASVAISIIFFLLFLLYGITIVFVRKQLISFKQIGILIAVLVVFGVFAYPAFSYDIFNYMFTAKTVLVYGQNPYLVKPIVYTGIDPWLSFLRWTHLVSAYTPLWIGVSFLPFLVGFGYFLPTLFAMKALLVFFYLATVWGIYEVAKQINAKYALLSLVLFACNPLVYIEAVVSPHNDIMMMAFALLSWVLFLRKKQIVSIFSLSLSIASKLMTGALFVCFPFMWNRWVALGVMSLALCIGFIKKELLPWYALWVLPFASLCGEVKEVVIISFGLSLGLLLRYIPYVYFGDYSSQMQTARNWVTIIPIAISLFLAFVPRIIRKTTGK